MTELSISINDQLLDLDEETKFQATYNGFNIFNPTKGLLSYTNAISVPLTKKNYSIIDYQGVHSNSLVPYSELKIKVIDNGAEVFAGVCYLGKVSGRINFVGITEGVTIFDKAKLLDLDEIDDASWGTLASGGFFPLRNGVNGLFAPLIDWGKFKDVPVVEFTDPTITSDTKWDQDTSAGGQVWNFSTGNAVAIINGNYTKQLRTQETVFWAGYAYSFDLNFTTSSANACTCTVYGYSDSGLPTQLGTQNYNTVGAKTLTVSFTPFENYITIAIVFNTGVVGAQTITITSLTQPTVNAGAAVNLQFPFYYPVYAYRMILEKGLTQIGVPSINLNLNAAQQDYIDHLLMPHINGSGEFSQKFIDKRTVQRRADGTQVMAITAPSTTSRVQFPIQTKMDYGSWATDTYSVPFLLNSKYFVQVEVELVINVTASVGNGARFSVRYNGAGTLRGTDNISGVGRKIIKTGNLSAEINPLYAGYEMDGSTIEIIASNTVSGGQLTFTVESAILNLTPIRVPRTAPYNLRFRDLILPDMPLFNLLKDYQIRTASLMRFTRFGDLEMKPIQNIIEDKANAVDWTKKRDRSVDDVEFSLSGYARQNVFENSKVDILEDNLSINLQGAGLAEKKTFYTSDFEVTNDIGLKGIAVATVPAFKQDSQYTYRTSSNYEFNVDAEEVLGLVKYRDNVVSDPNVNYGSGNTTCKVALPAPWSEFKNLFFTGLEQSLDTTKVIDRVYDLTPQDIADLDNFKLIFDDYATYIIITLKYIPGKKTKVTLFKTI